MPAKDDGSLKLTPSFSMLWKTSTIVPTTSVMSLRISLGEFFARSFEGLLVDLEG